MYPFRPTQKPNNRKLARWIVASGERHGFIVPQAYPCNGEGKTIFVLPGIAGACSLPLQLINATREVGSVVILRMDLQHIPHKCCDELERLAEAFVDVIRNYQPTGPYILIGYCFGGTLAFEVARQLDLMNETTELLATIDAGRDPDLRWFDFPQRTRSAIRFIQNVPHWIKSTHQRQQWRSTFLKGLKKLSSILNMVQYQFPSKRVMRNKNRPLQLSRMNDECYANTLKLFHAYNTYRPKKYTGRIVLYRANIRPLFHSLSHDSGWLSATDHLDIVAIPGDHQSMLTGEGLAILTQDIPSRIQSLATTEASENGNSSMQRLP